MKREVRPIDGLSDNDIMDAIEEFSPDIKKLAKALGVSYQALYWRIKKSESLSNFIQVEREKWVDDAETVLRELVSEKNFNAIKLLLESLGKSRGYGVTKGELTTNNTNVNLNTDVSLDQLLDELDNKT